MVLAMVAGKITSVLGCVRIIHHGGDCGAQRAARGRPARQARALLPQRDVDRRGRGRARRRARPVKILQRTFLD